MWEVAGSLIGQMMAQGNYDQIAKLRQEAMARFGNTNLSSLEALAKETLGPSKVNGVKMDSKYKGTQDAALEKLMGVANSNGMDAQSVEKLNAAKNEAFGVQRGITGAMNQDLAQRGMLGSGAQVQGAISGQQGGIDRAYQGAIKTSADASRRSLEALMAGGKMAAGMGQDDLAQKNLAAGADDRIAQFNLGHKTDAEGRLLDAKLRIAGGQNAIGDKMAGDESDAAERTKGIARGVGKAAGTGFNYLQSGDADGLDYDDGAQRNVQRWRDPYDEDGWTPYPGGA